jgi:hypothetical protein
MGGKEKTIGSHNRAWLNNNVIQIITTLTLGSRPKQGLIKLQVKNKTQKSNFMFPRV